MVTVPDAELNSVSAANSAEGPAGNLADRSRAGKAEVFAQPQHGLDALDQEWAA